MGGEKFLARSVVNIPLGSPPHGRGKRATPRKNGCPGGITPAWAGKSGILTFTNLFAWDHPRMGGEKSSPFSLFMTLWGSPPHGRGKARILKAHANRRRITPAWAGKRARGLTLWVVCGDHPRMGGEKLFDNGTGQGAQGSPPHGRGKGITARPKGWSGRITPAWAGKSFECTVTKKCVLGSPPHGRGKVQAMRRGEVNRRITPAWAGKRAVYQADRERNQDHPRMGGEKHEVRASGRL